MKLVGWLREASSAHHGLSPVGSGAQGCLGLTPQGRKTLISESPQSQVWPLCCQSGPVGELSSNLNPVTGRRRGGQAEHRIRYLSLPGTLDVFVYLCLF